MDIPPKDICFDIYIDDLIGIGLDKPAIRKALKHAPPLALHILFRPLIPEDPIPRNRIINETKHPAEGLLEEVKRILGWIIDFRKFTISLPIDKLKDWSYDINTCLKNKKCKVKTLESLIGRFNHAGYILPFGKYFLNRLRYRLKKSTARNYKTVYLEQKELEDLSLWKKLLFQATTTGIDINHVTFTEPSIICYSDACEHGIGGYIVNGPAWRFEIPPQLIGIFSINLNK